MASTQEHYDDHLGPIYTWMLGGFDAACSAAEEELDNAGLAPAKGDVVVDLGCGSGQFSIVLARNGASVLAVDCCKPLLAELDQRSGELNVRTIHSDMLSFRRHLSQPASGIVCMGDTLTHLPSKEDVQVLLRDVASALKSGGVFVATFRNYAGDGPMGDARFIPVQSDANRILTCFIEYGRFSVGVTDLVHERDGDSWQLRTSSYEKLRLEPAEVSATLEESGCHVRTENGSRGMVRIVAVR